MRVTRSFLSALCAALITLALLPTLASAIPRDVVMSRARAWVTREVPYSTPLVSPPKYHADEAGDLVNSSSGWRTDCSGFVSMCWDLRDPVTQAPVAPTTSTLPGRCTLIKKQDLLIGDAMIKPGTHAFIFGGWTDSSMTQMTVWEEPNSDIGKAVTRVRRWVDLTGYSPYRYKGIDPEFADVQERVQGFNRYETAVAAVAKSFPTTTTTSVPAVIIASGVTWPDALGGAALAGSHAGPLLLTAPDGLPSATREAITRLKPKKVIILGGPATVSEAVKSQIASMTTLAGIPVTRIEGRNRYEVSNAVARAAVAQARSRSIIVDTAYLTTGLNYPDALAASPVSAKTRRPIVLTGTDALPAGTLKMLQDLKITKVIILGGTNSVSEQVVAELAKGGITATRIAGRNRYEVAVSVARHGKSLGMSWKSLGLASGDAYADALSGGIAQGQCAPGALLLLTPRDELTNVVANEIRAHRTEIGLLRVFGGSVTVEQPAREAAALALRAQ